MRLCILLFVSLFCIFGVFDLSPAEDSKKIITLPAPSYKGGVSVEEAIYKRKSIRRYKDESLSLQEVSQLLWAGGGKTVDGVTGPTRAYPSAGGIYPLEIYVTAGKVENLELGVYQYDWTNHSIKMIKKGDIRSELMRACLGQRMIDDAPISIIFMADYGKTKRHYGRRGEVRYVPMDVGGAGENVSLQAVALGLGTVIIGAFNDEQVRKVLGIEEMTPLYIMPVGRPE